jgi:hypothetical protein
VSGILFVSLTTGCLKFQAPNADSPSSNDKNTSSTRSENIVHDFSVRKKINIPKFKIYDDRLSAVIIENSSGSFRMILDKEELKYKNSYEVPVSKLDEKIVPKYIYK